MYKTFDQILAELQQDMVSEGTQLTDFSSGSQIQTALAVVARALRNPWYMLEQLVELFFVSTTDGPFLDLRVGERGVVRKAGVAATGPISFTRTTPSPVGSLVPAGSLFTTTDGTVELSVTADINLASGWTSGSGNVQCTVVGVIGNLAAGTVLQVAGPAITGLQTITVGAGGLTGGVDAETDDELRARYLEVIQNPVDGGTPADYSVWAKEVVGITGVSVFPLARGNGTVDVVVTNGGIPSAGLISQVQTVVSGNRPIGADAQVKAPTAHNIDVTATVTPGTGYAFATLKPLVQQAITNYLATVPIGGTVRVAGIQSTIMAVKGVIDTNISIPAANIVLGTEELAIAGNLNITPGS